MNRLKDAKDNSTVGKGTPLTRPAAAPRSTGRRTLAAGGATVAIALGLAAVGAPPLQASTAELVVNGGFENGTSGWRTNDSSNQQLAIVNGGHGGSHAVVLTTKSSQTAVLNDSINTVKSTKAGTRYAVSAWVRTDTPGISGQVRIREEQGNVPLTGSSFYLTTKNWTKVAFDVTAAYSGSSMDLNILAWGLKPGQSLQMDDVSIQAVPAGTPAPTPPPGTPAPAPGKTVFGSSLGQSSSGGTREEALAREEGRFGSLGTVRLFDNTVPSSWSSLSTMKGKSLVISFRPLPADVLAGKYDAALLAWFKAAPRDQETYWSYVHEPEAEIARGSYTAAAYRAAWQHIVQLEKQANNQHLHSTLILMGWTVNPASKLNWKDYYPGAGYINVLGWDPYNDAGSVAGPSTYPDPANIYGGVVAVSKAAGKPFGIAETGSRLIPSDPSGAGRGAWLTKVGKYLKDNNALFVAYWDSAVKIGDYRLTDAPSAAAWRKLVSG